MSYDRALQESFGGLIGATRFKILKGGRIGEVECPKSGKKDAEERRQSCYRIEVPIRAAGRLWLE